jgi:ABC-2 type transport system ATP-binding protein
MGVLEVTNLNKTFGKFVAVNNISFSLKEGEILGLLGPNGAGKTTTIQMLLAVLTPTSGTIEYFGKPLDANREKILQQLNFSSTYTNFPWELSVKEILHYTSYLYAIADRKKKMAELVKQFRLNEILNLRISELSAGQLTRVNLAKAFINDPKILLLDEPTASLDPEVAKLVRDFILEQQTKKKVSVIFTSHNMTEVEEVCDRILFINNGKIVADDTPENLMQTIDETTVSVAIDKAKEAPLLKYTHGKKWKTKYQDRQYSIRLKESEISELLTFLSKNNIPFYEISIDKPSLEDYFLKIASQNVNRDI